MSTRDLVTPSSTDARDGAMDGELDRQDGMEQRPGAMDGATGAMDGARDADAGGPLLSAQDAMSFQQQWEALQTEFIDEPRRAVEAADELVATVMRRLAEGFAQEREGLEGQWSRGEDVSTEDLRIALQRYRSFFRRLVTT